MRGQHQDIIVLQPSIKKWAPLAVLGVALAAFSRWVGMSGGSQLFLDILGGAIFAVSAVKIYGKMSGKAYLELSPQGLVQSGIFGTKRWDWNQIENFRVFEVRSQGGTSKTVRFTNHEKTGLLSSMNKKLAGGNDALNDTFGLKAEELAALLSVYHDRVIAMINHPRPGFANTRFAAPAYTPPPPPMPVRQPQPQPQNDQPPQPVSYTPPPVQNPAYQQSPLVQKAGGRLFGRGR